MPFAHGSGSPLLERRRGFEPRKIRDVVYSHPLSIPSGRRICPLWVTSLRGAMGPVGAVWEVRPPAPDRGVQRAHGI